MRILLTNDDGIDAPGLKTLRHIAGEISSDVWVVAPENEQSGASRSMTMHDPLRMRQVGEKQWAVSGTPVDCVLMACHHLMDGKKPDLLLSGVNRGQNIAEDITYSGTVAGAMEGVMMGVPALALSQAFGFETYLDPHWETAKTHAAPLIKRLLKEGWPPASLLNINFPDRPPDEVKGVEITRQGQRDHPLIGIAPREDPRGRDYYWLRFARKLSTPKAGTDLHAVYGGKISITPLQLNLTDDATHKHLCTRMKTYAARC